VTGLHIEGISVRFTSTTRKLYAAGIAFAIALAVLRMYGLTLADLARMARAKFIESVADSKAVTSREYSDRVSRSLREEAARIPVEAPVEGGTMAVEISRELVAERKRILRERADNLEKVGAGLLTGDLESLKKQAEENARRAGGNH
jgi:hypothetical protein